MKITPDFIDLKKGLEPGQVIVFGSNYAGIHGAGLARDVHQALGFPMGLGFGFNEEMNAFAFATKDKNIKTLSLEEIETLVDVLEYNIKNDSNLHFLITEVGCGLAGYEPKDIAPLFRDISKLPNVSLPKRFWEIIKRIT
jgi:hypothetical protein